MSASRGLQGASVKSCYRLESRSCGGLNDENSYGQGCGGRQFARARIWKIDWDSNFVDPWLVTELGPDSKISAAVFSSQLIHNPTRSIPQPGVATRPPQIITTSAPFPGCYLGKSEPGGSDATDHLYHLWCAADRHLDRRDGDRYCGIGQRRTQMAAGCRWVRCSHNNCNSRSRIC